MKITFLGNFSVDYSSETHHAKSLIALGHEVICLQEGQTSGDVVLDFASQSDLLIVVHTHGWETPGLSLPGVMQQLKGKVPIVTYHLDLWKGINREKDLQDPYYKLLDWFFCTDKLMAEWLNENTEVKGYYLPAGVFHEEAYLTNSPKVNDVIFVGSKGYHEEWNYRPQLIEWLVGQYSDRFSHYGNDGKGVVRGHELNKLYAETKISIGDTLCINFDYPYYFSDRLFESVGRGAFTIFPYIKGLENNFILGEEIVTYTYGDFEELKRLIDYYLSNDEAREKIRRAGNERVKRDHLYTNRWQKILEVIR
jgi:hypothetical protein